MSNNASSDEAARNRQFQADQTGTAYQRAVEDLKKAGLNPMLAYTNGGASSGGGAQATMQNVASSAVSNALSAKTVAAQVENMKEQKDQIKSQTDLNRASTINVKEQKDQIKSQTDLNRASAIKQAADAQLSISSAANADAVTRALQAEAAARSADARRREDIRNDPVGSAILSAGLS